MKPDPPALEIDRYMSSVVLTVSPLQTLAEAVRLMRLHEVRHLPVVAEGRVVGVVSQRDVYLVQSLDPTQPASILVEEAMTTPPYLVEPETPVDRVAREMVRRRIGSAVVARDGRLLGLFTTTDALLALAAVVEGGRSAGADERARGTSRRPR
jgi:acetoin utilization protein AcuB